MGIIRSGTWQHGQDMHVSLQMLAATAALLPNVESGMDQKCSDRFYDTCLLPNPEGGPTCETDVDGVVVDGVPMECPDKCDSCHRCGDNQAKDKCNFVHDIGCFMDESLAPVPQTGADDFESCKSVCLKGYSYAVWDPREAIQCLCYAGGDRHCNKYAVRLDVPPGGDLGTCLSQSVDVSMLIA